MSLIIRVNRKCAVLKWSTGQQVAGLAGPDQDTTMTIYSAFECSRLDPLIDPRHKYALSAGCALWKCDRGADKVAFGKLDATIAQNIVSGGVMKIEVGQAEIQ